ncbi:hypothetical protein LTR70_010054 [Exophiala xenobiotica]|uniref:Uncharacterized protein n=1 Tax=Lithohypha guttulata TaxID=1690604 RepID=A0ABR0JVE0_9EURO|nr:hypothetical protein LTR24_009969 [Lithohypha guttulata]KAK5309715.1 hypothetical protein LTR70_010054 [Exophiala xenobiotica]
MQQHSLLAMIGYLKRKTFCPPQPDRQPANAARHKHFPPNGPRNATARSPSSVKQRQAAHVGPPVVPLRHDLDTGSGQAGGPIVCGAPPPSPSSTMSEEIRAENENDAATTLDGLSQLETNGESFHVFSPGRQHDSLVSNMGRGATLPVTPVPASSEHVRSLLTPPAEKSPQDQMRQHFVAVLQNKFAVRDNPGQQTVTLVHPETTRACPGRRNDLWPVGQLQPVQQVPEVQDDGGRAKPGERRSEACEKYNDHGKGAHG